MVLDTEPVEIEHVRTRDLFSEQIIKVSVCDVRPEVFNVSIRARCGMLKERSFGSQRKDPSNPQAREELPKYLLVGFSCSLSST